MGKRLTAARITAQVLRGNFKGFEKMVRKMNNHDLGEELGNLVQAPQNFQNRDLIERMIQILGDEAIRREPNEKN